MGHSMGSVEVVIRMNYKQQVLSTELLKKKRRFKSVLRDSGNQSKKSNDAISLVGNRWAYFFTSILKWNLAFLFFNASLFVS